MESQKENDRTGLPFGRDGQGTLHCWWQDPDSAHYRRWTNEAETK